MVGHEEVTGRGGVAPGVSDGTAAEEGFGGQTDADLPHDDLIREGTVSWFGL